MVKKKLLVPVISIIGAIALVLIFLGKWNLLVWGLVLLCPLMHLFGHNHSGHSGHNQSDRSKHLH